MQRAPTDRADVCIVGAGPAGALVASRLASDGHDVTVLEAGRRFDFDERQGRMEQSIRPGDRGNVWEMGGQRDDYSNNGARTYPLNVARVKGVGGSTLHWQGMVMRLHEADFDSGAERGVGPDWPIEYADLRAYYAEARTGCRRRRRRRRPARPRRSRAGGPRSRPASRGRRRAPCRSRSPPRGGA